MRQMKAAIRFTVNVVEENGHYWAEVAEMPGCFVSGRSEEEIRGLLPEAMLCQLPVGDAEVTVGEAEGRDLAAVGASPGTGRVVAGHPTRGAAVAPSVARRVVDHPSRPARGDAGRCVPATGPGDTGAGVAGQVVPIGGRRRPRR